MIYTRDMLSMTKVHPRLSLPPSDLHTTSSAAPQHYGEVGAGLPPKNGPLSSSIGSVATITTVADKANDPEECGRVAGWVASFDRLLQDPLGVHTLLVSIANAH